MKWLWGESSNFEITCLIAVGFAVVPADRVVLGGADAAAAAELEAEFFYARRERRDIDVTPEGII